MKDFVRKLSTNIKLYEKLKSDFTYHSSAIEGSTVSRKDNIKIINAAYSKNSAIINQELLIYKHDEVYENRNLGIVFDKILASLVVPLSREMICEWHALLKKDTQWARKYYSAIGKYRTVNVDVGDSINFAISFEQVNEQMKNFLDDINFKRHFSIEDISNFHCRFEKIHPFLDGNGRIGRIIMLRQCLICGINPFLISNDTRGDYINALRLYHQNGSSLFLMQYCKKQQLIFTVDYAEYLITHENRYEISIFSWFKTHDILKRLDVEHIFNVKSTGAKNILNKLIQEGLIVKHNIGKSTFYTLK